MHKKCDAVNIINHLKCIKKKKSLSYYMKNNEYII